jgi:hypothetical protein
MTNLKSKLIALSSTILFLPLTALAEKNQDKPPQLAGITKDFNKIKKKSTQTVGTIIQPEKQTIGQTTESKPTVDVTALSTQVSTQLANTFSIQKTSTTLSLSMLNHTVLTCEVF